MEAQSESDVRDKALASLKRKREFRSHLFVYLAVNAMLWLIWLLSDERGGGEVPWPLWVTVFWGLGVAINAWHVYGQRPISDQEIEREMQRIQGGR